MTTYSNIYCFKNNPPAETVRQGLGFPPSPRGSWLLKQLNTSIKTLLKTDNNKKIKFSKKNPVLLSYILFYLLKCNRSGSCQEQGMQEVTGCTFISSFSGGLPPEASLKLHFWENLLTMDAMGLNQLTVLLKRATDPSTQRPVFRQRPGPASSSELTMNILCLFFFNTLHQFSANGMYGISMS